VFADRCIFCRIVAGEAPAETVNRGDGFLAIRDINPKADVHVLVLPEQHIETFRDISALPPDQAKRFLDFTAETASMLGLEEYRLMMFVGEGAGQTVFHVHMHLLGGRFRGLPA
jgi:histidine triad (HIT) family protein